MKKVKVIAPLILGVLLIFCSIWYYTSDPATFPTDEELIAEMADHFSIVSNSVIQDRVFLDDRHVFVPFIAKDVIYGLSLWEWKNRKWNEVLVSTSGSIKVWKVNSKDPTSYYAIWNYPPQDQVKYMKHYLINKRGFHISEGEQHYDPAVQLEETITLTESLYGNMKLSKEWTSVINSLNGSTVPSYYFGWNTYDSSDKIIYPKVNENGGSSSGGNTEIKFPVFLNETEIE